MTETKEKKVEDIRKEAEGKIKCPVGRSLYYITEFLNGPMCGRCFPCEMGTYEARIRLEKLENGEGSESDLLALKRIMNYMLVASMCKKGKDTARFVLEWMESGIFKQHTEGECPLMECRGLIRYRIIPELCIICGDCKDVCKYNAIMGEKKKPYLSGYLPFEIRQVRCTRCGECIGVCPTKAIVLESKAEFEKLLTPVKSQ